MSQYSQSGKSNQKRKNQTEMMNEEHVTKTMEQLKSMRYRSYSSDKPWLDAEGELIWSQSRVQAAKLVFSQSFETCMGLIIVGNLMLIVYEANESAKCFPDYANNVTECPFRSEANLWLYVTNILLLVTFSMECMLRAYVERGAYVWNKWNCIDLFTVLAGWVGVAASNVFNATLLRMFRLVRVVRALRVLISVPEFYLLITGLYSSIKAIIFGALMLVAVIIFWAVISVELLHPIASSLTWDECPRCPDGFRGIFAASLTLFQQIVAGDSWGEISIRLVEAKPWTSILLFSMLITISLGMLNLILAVIVERAAEARENDHEAKIKQKQKDRSRSMEDLASFCASMDEDNNGMISFEELWKGYEEVSEFKKLMEVMDLKREDMATVFNVLETDFNQEVPYLELCQHLGSFFKRDPVIMQSLVRYSVMEVRKVLENEVVNLLQQQTQMLRLLLQEKGLQLPPMPRTSPLVSVERIASATSQASQPEKKPHRVCQASVKAPPGVGGVVLSRLSQDLSILEAELQPLFAKAQELADSIATKSVREHTIDIDNMAMNLQFNELSQRFEARIQDVQRLQQRCGSLLRPPESREAQAHEAHEAHEVHETHEAHTLGQAEGNASEARSPTSLAAFPT